MSETACASSTSVDTLGSQRIQVGCQNYEISVMSENRLVILIRHQKKDVLRLHLSFPPMSIMFHLTLAELR